jgi:hypothetical protein
MPAPAGSLPASSWRRTTKVFTPSTMGTGLRAA